MLTFDIERIVPRFIRNDRNGYAMMKAIEAALKYFCEVCGSGIDCYRDSDRMPEWRLDEMAWEHGAVWYDSTTGIEEKRNQVKSIHEVFRSLGTYDGVKRAIESVFGACEIIENAIVIDGINDADPIDMGFRYAVQVSDPSARNEKLNEFLRIAKIVHPVRCNVVDVTFKGTNNTTTINAMTAIVGTISTATATAR